jgi:hypothetical protein
MRDRIGVEVATITSSPGIARVDAATIAAESWRDADPSPEMLESMCRSFMVSSPVKSADLRHQGTWPKSPSRRSFTQRSRSKTTRRVLLRGFSDACLRASAHARARQASENP